MNTKVCSVTSDPTQNQLNAAEHLSDELRRSQVFLMASTLLVMKAKNIYWNTSKTYITMEIELSP